MAETKIRDVVTSSWDVDGTETTFSVAVGEECSFFLSLDSFASYQSFGSSVCEDLSVTASKFYMYGVELTSSYLYIAAFHKSNNGGPKLVRAATSGWTSSSQTADFEVIDVSELSEEDLFSAYMYDVASSDGNLVVAVGSHNGIYYIEDASTNFELKNATVIKL